MENRHFFGDNLFIPLMFLMGCQAAILRFPAHGMRTNLSDTVMVLIDFRSCLEKNTRTWDYM
ncbi:hypothetical protein DNH61_06955 [Paenibacillus sambharensis]|uniref:Uncharacterized protein n=1 Tax=Paenibacillus sambharensis TaxID=1803190 RepID=A0A2W1LYF0_9BACL|nr:hypothetical protein DNH61_06955 [Paenibacillus sambharensis]